MGTCMSTPVPAGADRHNTAELKATALVGATCIPAPVKRCSSGSSQPWDATGPPLQLLQQAQAIQGALASVSVTPGLGLSEAAELLQAELGVALVSVFGFPGAEGPDGPPAAVLLAAHGRGASRMERHAVTSDAAWSCLRLRGCEDASIHGCVPQAGGKPPLPADWAMLHEEVGMRSFLIVPIGPVTRPSGALMLAAEAPGTLGGERWLLLASVAAASLLGQLSHWQTEATCSLLLKAAAVDNRVALIELLLGGARAFLGRATGSRTGVRLALLDSSGSKALLFEQSAAAHRQGRVSFDLGPEECQSDYLVAMELPLSNTLLASAIALRKARFVRDCTAYMQSAAHPARDIYTQPAQLVSSLVVVPLLRGESTAMGALYLTLECPSDFSDIQAPLLGFINSVTPLLHLKLQTHIEEIWDEAQAVRGHSTRLKALKGRGASRASLHSACNNADLLVLGSCQADGDSPAGTRSGLGFGAASRPASSNGGGSGCARRLSSSFDSIGGALGEGRPSSKLAAFSVKRLCTEAMVKAVERRVLALMAPDSAERHVSALDSGMAAMEEWEAGGGGRGDSGGGEILTLQEPIGAGGFGSVWRGRWRGRKAGIKVMYQRSTEQDAMRDAVEMAVLSAVCHPHVVQVFACLTDMVEATGESVHKSYAHLQHSLHASAGGDGAAAPAALSPARAPVFRRLLPFEDPEDVDACNIVVMEYCDLGSLRQVLQSGAFHQMVQVSGSDSGSGGYRAAADAMAVDLPGLLGVALEVAEAVSYLHSIRLSHCDIKLDNVFLKTDPSRSRGYVAKLGDFGLTRLLSETSDSAINVAGAGTASHLAPELFVAGTLITTAADSYSFGIFLYELYIGGAHAYQGLTRAAVAERVSRAGMRPRFPRGTPPALAELAAACWAHDPTLRPTFRRIVLSLRRILDSVVAPMAMDQGAGI